MKLWLRNIARHPQSFWLPTASGRFYFDFVAQLKDGRLAVIEYKCALLAGSGVDDTNEKRAISRLWEQSSGGRGVFIVIEKQLGDRDMRGQLMDRLSGG